MILLRMRRANLGKGKTEDGAEILFWGRGRDGEARRWA
jgi:hypothetical protein